jgi:hypothetical protein
MTDDRLLCDLTIATPRATVWRALREPAEVRRWHGWEYDGIEDEIREIYVDGARVVEDERVLELPPGTRVELEHRDGDGTGLRVTRAGGEPGDAIDEGWVAFFAQLRFFLERHPGADRRTGLRGPGDPPAGEEWFRSAGGQVGVVVDGALVVAGPERTVVHAWD